MSLSFTVHLAGAVLFGPAFAMVVVLCGLAITDGVVRRAPFRRTAFNMAQMAVSVGLCGLVYQALKVPGPVDLVRDAPALALAALVYLLVNDSLVAGVVSMTGRSFLAEWKLSFKDILLPYASMGPLGALAAYSYQASPWSLLYFPPLLLVVYNGFKLFVSLQRETDRALVALADSIDRRDQYTYEHSARVAEHVEATARQLGLAPREIDVIAAAARVHDLGKIATDDRVLLKESTLSPEERKHIERHAAEGDELAGRFSMFRQGRRLIRHHHERWDGTGYPDGLAAAEIPLGARIISVADSYDAMTSDRPYRKALPHEAAVHGAAPLRRHAVRPGDRAGVHRGAPGGAREHRAGRLADPVAASTLATERPHRGAVAGAGPGAALGSRQLHPGAIAGRAQLRRLSPGQGRGPRLRGQRPRRRMVRRLPAQARRTSSGGRPAGRRSVPEDRSSSPHRTIRD